jgi:hypothetical protein
MTRRSGVHLTHHFEETFDVGRLQLELAAVLQHHDIVPHYRSYLANGWGAITLVGPNGDAQEHRSVAVVKGAAVEYLKTPAMQHTPYIESILSTFPGKSNRVRLMRLEAGRKIFWHHDGFLFGLDRRIARFHIPIITNPHVHLQVSHEDCHWQAGNLYFLDNSFPHRLVNGGSHDRVHLVFDMEVTPELVAMFPAVFAEQVEARQALRERCFRWVDNTVGLVYKAQKRWQMKLQKLQKNRHASQERNDTTPATPVKTPGKLDGSEQSQEAGSERAAQVPSP